MKLCAGVAPQRTIPSFAQTTFVDWFRSRAPSSANQARPSRPLSQSALQHGDVPRFQTDTYSDGDGQAGAVVTLNPHSDRAHSTAKRVLLWPDTFTNFLRPEAAKAAVAVLEDAGFQVDIPRRSLCCGRPLYDWGMLDAAKGLWRQTLDSLRSEIDNGIPLIGLEPSCVAAFRDELINLFPGEGRAKRLSQQTYLLSEFLEQEGYQPPSLKRKALVHGHCHHKAIMHMDAEVAILKKLGLDYELLDSGCCGMAGAFGFERKHYDVSIKCGERVLLPAVRDADEDTLIIANGFSCCQQIEQCTGRKSVHLAQVLQMAIDGQSISSEQRPSKTFQPAARPSIKDHAL